MTAPLLRAARRPAHRSITARRPLQGAGVVSGLKASLPRLRYDDLPGTERTTSPSDFALRSVGGRDFRR